MSSRWFYILAMHKLTNWRRWNKKQRDVRGTHHTLTEAMAAGGRPKVVTDTPISGLHLSLTSLNAFIFSSSDQYSWQVSVCLPHQISETPAGQRAPALLLGDLRPSHDEQVSEMPAGPHLSMEPSACKIRSDRGCGR